MSARRYKYLSRTAQILFRDPIVNVIRANIPDLRASSATVLFEDISNKVNHFANGDVLADIYEDEQFYPTHFIYTIYKTEDIEYAKNYTPTLRGELKDVEIEAILHVFVKPSREEFCSEYDIMLETKQLLADKYYSASQGFIITSSYHKA